MTCQCNRAIEFMTVHGSINNFNYFSCAPLFESNKSNKRKRRCQPTDKVTPHCELLGGRCNDDDDASKQSVIPKQPLL